MYVLNIYPICFKNDTNIEYTDRVENRPLTVFKFKTYKPYLKYRWSLTRGDLSRAAQSLNCQRSHLSRVISEEWHLTTDQAFLLAGYWRLPLTERNYFIGLVEFERASAPEYKNHLSQKISEMRRENDDITKNLKKPTVDIQTGTLDAVYFSNWMYSAIHYLTACPAYQTADKISARLGIQIDLVTQVLRKLESMALVRADGGRWHFLSGHVHIDKGASVSANFHQNHRTLALSDIMRDRRDQIHFSAFYTLSKEDIEVLREEVLSLIQKLSEVATPSPAEELISVSIDFFKP